MTDGPGAVADGVPANAAEGVSDAVPADAAEEWARKNHIQTDTCTCHCKFWHIVLQFFFNQVQSFPNR